jgi:hypothetical protein
MQAIPGARPDKPVAGAIVRKMRSLATWALVAGLALIALAAVTDAFRAGSKPSESAAPAHTEPSPPRQPCTQAVAAMFRGEGGTTACVRAIPRRLGV